MAWDIECHVGGLVKRHVICNCCYKVAFLEGFNKGKLRLVKKKFSQIKWNHACSMTDFNIICQIDLIINKVKLKEKHCDKAMMVFSFGRIWWP